MPGRTLTDSIKPTSFIKAIVSLTKTKLLIVMAQLVFYLSHFDLLAPGLLLLHVIANSPTICPAANVSEIFIRSVIPI
jgi:hypothetical protein